MGSRMAPAIPLVGPVVSAGLLLASQILPTALHLCLESWHDPSARIIHTAYSQGSRSMKYYGDGKHAWQQYNKTNLLRMKLPAKARISPPDISSEMATTAMEVRKAVSEVKSLTKEEAPRLASNREILARREKFGVITSIDAALGHLSRIYFYLDYAAPATTFRTAVLLSLDPGLSLIEGRAINSPQMGAPGTIVMQCFDSLRARDQLPDKCFDPTKTGSARHMAVPFVNDTLVVKILGEGQIQLNCPSRHGIFYSTGTFVARISETCTVLGDGGLVVYEPPRAERTAGARGEFSVIWESAVVTSTFNPPTQPRLRSEIKQIMAATVTWSDWVSFGVAVLAILTVAAVWFLQIGLAKVEHALRATTGRSRAELEQLIKETSTYCPGPPPPVPPKKKVSFAPIAREATAPKKHHLIPLPYWSDAKPGPEDAV